MGGMLQRRGGMANRTDGKASAAKRDFFLRVEQRGVATRRDERTLPLFPLWLILEADGMLAEDARHLFERYQA